MIQHPQPARETIRLGDIAVPKQVRAPMSRARRAKQFQPFNALRGLYEAIAAKEKIPTPRRYLTEDMIAEIDKTLNSLRKGQIITVVYYGTDEQDYLQLTGPVIKVDPYWHSLQVGNTTIDFHEIYELLA